MMIPFETARLDALMAEAGLDLLLVTSKHNVQYMLGGHRAMFFDVMDAMGVSRYLPVLVYPRGAPERTAYIGHRLEANQAEVSPFWVGETVMTSWGSTDPIEKAAAFIGRHGLAAGRVGIEASFLPFDSAETLRRVLPGAVLTDCLPVLEQLRLRKSGRELGLLERASGLVLEAMAETFASVRPGVTTKRDMVETLRQAEVRRGLTFEYVLLTAGTSLNRAPSDQVVQAGDILSLDSGANLHGYIGDICRMGIVGEPDAELVGMLGEIEAIQRAAFAAVGPGVPGGAIYTAAEPLVARSAYREDLHFLAHGMGLVSHEAPHLTCSGVVPYGDEGARALLEPGVVLSIETTLRHPGRGFVKLEDTVVVTEGGYAIYGEGIRGWNRAG